MGPRKLLLKIIRELKPTSNVIKEYQVSEDGMLMSANENTIFNPSGLLVNQSIESGTSNSSKLNSTSLSVVNLNTQEASFNVVSARFSRHSSIGALLEAHKKEIESINPKYFLSTQGRQDLVKIVTSELIEVQGLYPKKDAKIALAEAIVKEFPNLKDSKTPLGHEYLYDPQTGKGFIEYRLWNVRTNASPSKKKYQGVVMKKLSQSNKAKPSGTHESSSTNKEQNIDEMINSMKNMIPTIENKNLIASKLTDTRSFRREWLKKHHPTITEVLDTYPRLLDYYGQMVNDEFNAIFSSTENDFIDIFPDVYTVKILRYAETHAPEIFAMASILKDDDLRAIVILAELLPVPNSLKRTKSSGTKKSKKIKGVEEKKSKGRKKIAINQLNALSSSVENDEDEVKNANSFPNPSLLHIVSEGTNLQNYVDNINSTATTNVQPFIIMMNGHKDTYFIQLDGHLIDFVTDCKAAHVFAILFKLFYVFDLRYPTSLDNFYNFIEHYIFNLATARSAVSFLHIAINNIVDDQAMVED